jgi:molybdopterin-guanine dinucleotide biosynthesis protein A
MSFSAVLLCGGESRRMGRDKALVQWRGRALWDLQLEKLRQLQPAKIFLSTRTEQSWRPIDVELVLDGAISRGPLSGLAATISRCDSDHLLALAVDLPLMTSAHLRHLLQNARTGTGVVPMIDGRAEPLAAIYPAESRAFFDLALSGPNASFQPLIRDLVDCGRLRTVEIGPEDSILYRNVNSRADLALA